MKFSLDDANRAGDAWGANCGPAALAAVLDLTLAQVRPHLGDFERKHYTNPTLMLSALRSLSVTWTRVEGWPQVWPRRGLVRIQWEGPWTAPGVPMRVRYRHSHWVGSRAPDGVVSVFDINCMCVGGWVALAEWRDQVVPWLLRQVEPKANGKWHQTHVLELDA